MTALDLRSLMAALVERDIRFVLIGGVAVAAHGVLRLTEDVDIVPEPTPENIGRLIAALVELDGTLPAGDHLPVADSTRISRLHMGANAVVDTRFGRLDIVQRLAHVPSYTELNATAVDADLLGVTVRVCSLGHLRAMKTGAGRPQDLADLERLPDS
jgi:hypothetical protein